MFKFGTWNIFGRNTGPRINYIIEEKNTEHLKENGSLGLANNNELPLVLSVGRREITNGFII